MIKEFIKTYVIPHKIYYISGLTALIVTNYIVTLIPLKMKDAINLLSMNIPIKEALQSILIDILILSLALMVIRTLSRLLIFIPGRLAEYNLRNDLYKHLMSLSMTFYRKEKIGDIMSRLTNDIQSLRLMSGFCFLHICNTIMIYTLVLYQMIKISPFLTMFILAPIPFILIAIRLFTKKFHLFNYAS